MKCLLPVLCAVALAMPVRAQDKERDIFNYVGQKKAPKEVKKIVFIADAGTHGGKGNHEFKAGAIYMARVLNSTYPNAWAVVHSTKNWPKELDHADAIIVLLNHGGRAATDANIKKAVEKNGAGFMAVHFGVEVTKGVQGDNYLKWIGGYFEQGWSVNPFWVAKIEKLPEHDITRGVKPFEINDEWYYHMRFVPDMKGVTPILTTVPGLKTLSRWDGKKDHGYNGNAAVMEEVKAGKPQHLAWAYVREDGGRGFGFTGYHNYANIQNDNFRTILLNAAAWTAKLEVPSQGIATKTPTKDDLEKLWQDGERIPAP